jgi:hypothetical protein
MESKPVSGPSWPKRRVLPLRRAPTCSCLVQPFSASRCPKKHQVGGELALLLGRGRVSGARLVENRRRFRLAAEIGVGVVESMVGKPPAHLVKEIVPLAERVP